MSTLVERLEALAVRVEKLLTDWGDMEEAEERDAIARDIRALRATGEGERLLRCVMEDYAKHGYVTAAVLDEITTTLAAAPTPAEPTNPGETSSKVVEPLRDAGAVAWMKGGGLTLATDPAHAQTMLDAGFTPLYAHPAPQQPAITGAMVSDALGIPRGDAALILQVEDGDRKINGRWLSHLPAAAARINAALTAAAQEKARG